MFIENLSYSIYNLTLFIDIDERTCLISKTSCFELFRKLCVRNFNHCSKIRIIKEPRKLKKIRLLYNEVQCIKLSFNQISCEKLLKNEI